MSDTSRVTGWWRKFRSLPTRVQVASWVGLAVLVIVGSVVGGESGSGTATPAATVSPTTAAPETPAAPTTSPPTTAALTPLPITLTTADFRDGGFSQDLHLGGGVYTVTLTSDKPGPGIEVRVYNCGTLGGIVGGTGVVLPKGQTTATEPTKPLEAGCYQLDLANLLEAKVTVKLAR